VTATASADRGQNEVLREILQSNLDLRRSMTRTTTPPDIKAA
jgi:hypothetical protein